MRDVNALRAVVYARLTNQTRDRKQALERCRGYCTAMRWKVTGEYVDFDIDSVKGDTEPGLWGCIEDLRAGRADVMVVTHLDAIARDSDRILALLVEASARGYYLCSLDERFDTTVLPGLVAEKCLRTLLTWVRRKRIEGRRPGEDKLFSEAAPPSFRACVERIVALRILGWKWNKIASKLNEEGYQMRKNREWNANAASHAYDSAIDLGMIDELTLRPDPSEIEKQDD